MLYLFLAPGFEETEALVPLDCIRRAGIDILTVGVGSEYVSGTHGIEVKTDISADEPDLTALDGILLPGGMPGTENLYNDTAVREIVSFCAQNEKLIASICAAPSIPGRMGLLNGRRAVCFPGFENQLVGHVPSINAVETDGCYITAKGAGCAFLFANAIIKYCKGKETADRVLQSMQYAQM